MQSQFFQEFPYSLYWVKFRGVWREKIKKKGLLMILQPLYKQLSVVISCIVQNDLHLFPFPLFMRTVRNLRKVMALNTSDFMPEMCQAI